MCCVSALQEAQVNKDAGSESWCSIMQSPMLLLLPLSVMQEVMEKGDYL